MRSHKRGVKVAAGGPRAGLCATVRCGDTVPLDFGNLGTDVSPLLLWAHDLDPGRAVHSCFQEVAEPSG